MPDIPNITDAVSQLGNSVEQIKASATGLTSVVELITSNLGKVGISATDAANNLNKFATTDFKNYISGASQATRATTAIADASATVIATISGSSRMFDEFNKNAKNAFQVNSYKQQLEDLKKGLGSVQDVANNFKPDTFVSFVSSIPGLGAFAKNLTGSLQDMYSATIKAIDGMTASAGGIEQFAANMISASAASGNLTDVLDSMRADSFDFDAISKSATVMTAQLRSIAGAVGPEAYKLAAQYSHLGKILDANNATTGISASKMSLLETAFKQAAGTGRSVEKVMEDYDIAITKLGKDHLEAAQYVADMSQASSALGLRFDQVRDSISQISQEFSRYGDQSQSAISGLYRWSDALKNSGLNANDSIKLIDKMTKSVYNLDVGSRALLSLRSGGPGGLLGALKIEQLLGQTGGADKVSQMMMENFKRQSGGGVISRDEAISRGSVGAAQYEKQAALLGSGAFGFKITDRQDQANFFKAFAEADKKGKSQQFLTQERQAREGALDAQVERGGQLTSRSVTALSEANAQMDFIKAQGDLINNQNAQKLTAASDSEIGRALKKSGEMAANRAGQEITDPRQNLLAGMSDIGDTLGLFKKTIQTTVDGIKDFGTAIGSIFKNPESGTNVTVTGRADISAAVQINEASGEFKNSVQMFSEAVKSVQSTTTTAGGVPPNQSLNPQLAGAAQASAANIQITGICAGCGTDLKNIMHNHSARSADGKVNGSFP